MVSPDSSLSTYFLRFPKIGADKGQENMDQVANEEEDEKRRRQSDKKASSIFTFPIGWNEREAGLVNLTSTSST